MYLLIQATFGGTTYQWSTTQVNMEDGNGPYLPMVKSLTSPKLAMDYEYGGVLRWKGGNITFWPSAFSGSNWPPPSRIVIDVYITPSLIVGVGGATKWFSGACWLSGGDMREGVTYTLYNESYVNVISSGTSYTGSTFVSTINALVTSLGGSLDSTNARTPSTTLQYYTKTTASTYDLMSQFCACNTHLLHEYSTGYFRLVALDSYTGSIDIGTNFFNPKYYYPVPVQKVTDTLTDGSGGTTTGYNHSGLNEGRSISYETCVANGGGARNSERARVLNLLNRQWVSLEVPLSVDIPTPGEYIYFEDQNAFEPLTSCNMLAVQFEPVLDQFKLRISGPGYIG